jgi:NADPH:quinone reductase
LLRIAYPWQSEGEVQIRVKAISMEAGDVAGRRDGGTRYAAVPGYAAAGTIVSICTAVEGS